MALLLAAMPFSANVFAQTGSGQVKVNAGSVYSIGVQGVTRSGAYSYVEVKADSVYPPEGYDNFTHCKTKLTENNITKTVISDEYRLIEGTGYCKVYINQGHMDVREFNILFAGTNSLEPAIIDFSYNTMD